MLDVDVDVDVRCRR